MANTFYLKDTGSLSWNATGTKITGLAGGTLSISAGVENIFHTNGEDRMIIKNDGKVGIGTNDPGYTLDVKRTDGPFENMRIINTAAGALYRSTDSTATTEMGTQGGLAVIRTSSTARLTIDSSGNVVIMFHLDIGSGLKVNGLAQIFSGSTGAYIAINPGNG